MGTKTLKELLTGEQKRMANRKFNTRKRNSNPLRTNEPIQNFSIVEDSTRSSNWFTGTRNYQDWERDYLQSRHSTKRSDTSDSWFGTGKVSRQEKKYFRKP